MIWHLMDSGKMNGFENMALDTALLESDINEPILRFYGWNPPALSLGRFQNTKDISISYLKEKHFDLVRRPSGGRAVLHYDELTYSVILPAFMVSQSVTETYLLISKAIARGLENTNLKCEISTDKAENYTRFSACFAVASIHEVMVDGKKLIGSAQVRKNNKVLQHGSIPLVSHVEEYVNCFLTDESEKNKLFERLKSSMTCVGEHIDVSIEALKRGIELGFKDIFNAEFLPFDISLDVSKYSKEVKTWD